jgi:hypothetical protein
VNDDVMDLSNQILCSEATTLRLLKRDAANRRAMMLSTGSVGGNFWKRIYCDGDDDKQGGKTKKNATRGEGRRRVVVVGRVRHNNFVQFDEKHVKG